MCLAQSIKRRDTRSHSSHVECGAAADEDDEADEGQIAVLFISVGCAEYEAIENHIKGTVDQGVLVVGVFARGGPWWE